VRILWHSVAPWLPTGYASQTAVWCRYLKEQGHDVAISPYYGNPGHHRKWEGMTVYPVPMECDVTALIAGHARRHRADVIVVLADAWLMDPRPLAEWPVIVWMPVDCTPLSLGDTYFLQRAGPNLIPLAMSKHGQAQIEAATGRQPRMIPHAIDTKVYTPDPRREELRAAFGIGPDQFAIGMNFNNIDPFRKATPEQLYAFARFHGRHPNTVMFCHTMVAIGKSLDLRLITKSLHIEDAVRFSDQYRMQTGGYSTLDMVRWYGAMDVLSNATMGEGFGLPAIEAQACGTPVILADNTTGPELMGPGWTVKCEPFWNMTHASWWQRPCIDQIAKAYEKAIIDKSPFKREAARQWARRWDVSRVGPLWDQLLADVTAGKPV
jgi:glycosyltransferase involved in cell wall biosynthesis